MYTNKKLKAGFSLIEILIVIGIIAALGALATPIIFKQLEKAKIVNATAVCTALEVAVDNFEQDYNYLPTGTGTTANWGAAVDSQFDTVCYSDTVSSGLLEVLTGLDTASNPKESIFFDPGEATGTRDGIVIDETAGTAELYDPWGQKYFIVVDANYSNDIQHPYDGTRMVRKSAICWSIGADGLGTSTPADQEQNDDNAQNFKK